MAGNLLSTTNDDNRSKISKIENVDEQRIASLLDRLGLNLVALNAEFSSSGKKIGELDSIFEYKGNLMLIEVKKRRRAKDRSQRIRAFFTKWSETRNLRRIKQRYGAHRHKVFRLYFDLHRKRQPESASLDTILQKKNNTIIYRNEVEILEENFKVTGTWELHNFLARLGVRRRNPPAREVPAIICYIRDKPVYLFSLPASELLECSHITRRYENDPGYQRAVKPDRIAKMRKGIRNGQILAFPNSILVNSRQSIKADLPASDDCPASITFSLPLEYSFLKVIDGQHRLLAFTKLPARIQESHDLSVIAFQQLTEEEESNLFVEINTTQKKVDPNLVLVLKADYADVTHKYWYDKVCVEVAKRLNTDSVLKGKIYMGYADQDRASTWVPLKTLVTSMKKNHYVGRRSLFQQDKKDIDSPTKKIKQIFLHLNRVDLLKKRNRFFLKARGIRILFRLVHLYERNRKKGNIKISFSKFMDRMGQVVDETLILDLEVLYGEGGTKEAVDKLIEKLEHKYKSEFKLFESDLRSLKSQ